MIVESIGKLAFREDISEKDAMESMLDIMNGIATPSQISAFITALKVKGEIIDEISGCAKAMREKMTKIRVSSNKILVDTAGTGGDGMNTFNISTIAAIVAAGAGLTIAKHGNRSISSKCGSADLLSSLGVKIDAEPYIAERALNEIGIAFLFAPIFHPSMKYAMATRKEIGIRTIFNILGPLSNPACATAQIVGVYDRKLTEPLARVLGKLGVRQAMVVHGLDGIDEITFTSETQVSHLHNGEIRTYRVTPGDFGFSFKSPENLKGGEPLENAEIALNILKGKGGIREEIVLINASATLYVGEMVSNFKEGISMAKESIHSGMALKKLKDLIEITNSK